MENNLKFRNLKNKIAHYVFAIISFSSIAILIVLLSDLIKRGFPYLNTDFITNFPSRFAKKSGILPAFLGSIWIVSLTTVISVILFKQEVILRFHSCLNNFIFIFLLLILLFFQNGINFLTYFFCNFVNHLKMFFF